MALAFAPSTPAVSLSQVLADLDACPARDGLGCFDRADDLELHERIVNRTYKSARPANGCAEPLRAIARTSADGSSALFGSVVPGQLQASQIAVIFFRQAFHSSPSQSARSNWRQ